MSRAEALQMASSQSLDLVEVSPMAEPPVVRVMDFGKFLFEQNKKAHAAKRKQKQIQVKEVKFRPGTEEADYQVKLRNIVRFLTEGDKAKVTLRYRAVSSFTKTSAGVSCRGFLRISPPIRWSSRIR